MKIANEFAVCIGDRPIESYTRPDGQTFKESLPFIPKRLKDIICTIALTRIKGHRDRAQVFDYLRQLTVR